jgi:hypothetical protein
MKWCIALVPVLALAWPARAAFAQDFPADGAYEPFPCGRDRMADGRRDEPDAIDEKDLVGDQERPAGFRAVDDDFLYLRMRLDANAFGGAGGAILPAAWGVAFDTDDDPEDYEILALVEGMTGSVLLYANTTTTTRDDPTDPADTPAVKIYTLADFARSTTAAGSQFGGGDDFYLSFALPWADLDDLGLTPATPVRVWVASSAQTSRLDGDFACHDGAGGPAHLSDSDSDRTVLDPDRDSDGDGYSDADEVEGGSDPNDPESRPSGGERQLAGGGGCGVVGGAGETSADVLLAAGLMLLAAWWRRRRERA